MAHLAFNGSFSLQWLIECCSKCLVVSSEAYLLGPPQNHMKITRLFQLVSGLSRVLLAQDEGRDSH